MVGLRRDVEERGNKKRNSGWTEYDIFMERKKLLGTESAHRAYEIPKEEPRMNLNYFGQSAYMEADTQTVDMFDNYTDYITNEINRTSPREVLREEEFYSIKGGNTSNKARDTYDREYNAVRERRTEKKRAERTAPVKSGGLSRYGKIFIALYVLIVAAVAFIIIAVNSSPAAEAKTIEGAVASVSNTFANLVNGALTVK